MKEIFNTAKTAEDYATKTPLFFGGEPGLVDTVHKRYPHIWKIYNEMRSLDWSENEFDFSTCLIDFTKAPKDIIDMMKLTIFWQWEADSVASRAPTVIIASYQPCVEVWATEQRISDNEQIHANSYSEIVRNSFTDPEAVVVEMLAESEAFRRLDKVNRTLGEIAENSRYIGLYSNLLEQVPAERRKAFRNLVLFYFTMLCLEKIQFMASFAITFTICKLGYFQEIGSCVRKIAQDEFEIHCQYRKEILKELFKMPEAQEHNFTADFTELFDEVIDCEMVWTDALFTDRQLSGLTPELVKQWVLYCAKEIAIMFALDSKYKEQFPERNPLPYMLDWLSPNRFEPAPQEQTITAYKTNTVVSDDAGVEFEI